MDALYRAARRIFFVFLALLLVALAINIWIEVGIYFETNEWYRVIANIDEFKRKKGRLPDPNNMEEMLGLGFELRTDYYPGYEHRGPNYYILSDSFGLDGPRVIYRSETKTWERK
jgi:hypothetical protein